MSDISAVSDSPRASQSRTWAGTLVSNVARTTHYLHLYAFPCAKCNGPVIVGSLGTREDDLSKETAVGGIGAVCLACGRRPETLIEPSVGHGFRPVEWEWAIKPPPGSDSGDDPLAAELSQDADSPRR